MKVDMPRAFLLGQQRWAGALEEAIVWGVEFPSEEERCGFFWSDGQEEIHFQPMHNTASSPKKGFTFSVAKTLEFLDHLRGDRSLVGLFHTHPGGAFEPSEFDMDMAKNLEGSALGSGFEHWLLAAGSPQALVRYDAMGILAKITGQFIVE